MLFWVERSLERMRLYVGNLPFKVNERDLQEFFEQHGVSPVEITLMRDRMSGEPRGFGFVEVSSNDSATALEVCNGKELMGRQLVINEARPRSDEGGGGGRGGRERRGSGGGRRY